PPTGGSDVPSDQTKFLNLMTSPAGTENHTSQNPTSQTNRYSASYLSTFSIPGNASRRLHSSSSSSLSCTNIFIFPWNKPSVASIVMAEILNFISPLIRLVIL